MGTEADCIAPGSCNDAGNTSPADATACMALFSDAGSCSDNTHSTEADCIAPGAATTLATPVLLTRQLAWRCSATRDRARTTHTRPRLTALRLAAATTLATPVLLTRQLAWRCSATRDRARTTHTRPRLTAL